jgi:hypothetical protein
MGRHWQWADQDLKLAVLMIKKYRWSATGAVLLLYLFLLPVAFAQTTRIVYSDLLSKGWANWSWAKVDLANTSHVHSGSKSIAVAASGWEALYFHHESFDPALVESVSFWIHGGTSGGPMLTCFDGGLSILYPHAMQMTRSAREDDKAISTDSAIPD